MKVKYSPRAQADIDAIIDYLAHLSPGGARAVADDIRAAVSVTGDMPMSGRAQDGGDLRKTVTRKYRYIVYYRIRHVVEIVTIQHPSKDRPYSDA